MGSTMRITNKKQIVNKLKTVMDPELGINIVDLGLIYDVKIEQGKVTIIATLTTPMCPIGPSLIKDIEKAVKDIKGVGNVKVTLTFNPPWDKSRMSESAKTELGIV